METVHRLRDEAETTFKLSLPLRDNFCEAAEAHVKKCPGCDAPTMEGPHRFSCYAQGARQVQLPVQKVGDKFVVDPEHPIVKAEVELIRKRG